MAIALITVLLLADVALGFAGWYGGFRVAYGLGEIRFHVSTGLFAAFLSVFAHCMSMFYFIGTGKVIREAVQDRGLAPGYAGEARAFKTRYFPIASLTIAATMAAPILGGALDAGRVVRDVHLWVAVAALVLNLAASAVAVKGIWGNLGLIARVEAECRSRP